jgi:lipase maturation factor 1
MEEWLQAFIQWLLGPETPSSKFPFRLGQFRRSIATIGASASAPAEPSAATAPASTHLWARWIFLRALGLIYFSAFYSFLFQVKGLIGPNGILPAGEYLQAVSASIHPERFWFAPTLFWFGSSDRALMLVCWIGLLTSLLIVFNLWPRASLLLAFVCFLSFIGAAQVFASYQSDGMLLEAGFISLFFAPPGFLPGLGRAHAPSRFSLFLLRWEWFRIYFESGVAKMASGDQSWRHFTAMDDYYQNGPLPTWIGWYVQHFPHGFHAFTVFLTLAIELVLVWMFFLPRRFRIACFCIVTPFEIGIILTANYAFLNYIVLCLGFLLLDDRFLEWIIPAKIRSLIDRPSVTVPATPVPASASVSEVPLQNWRTRWRTRLSPLRLSIAGICLGLVFYSTTAQFVWELFPSFPLPQRPVELLDPFRIANRYGLFAVMTHARYEIEFQGSVDGKNWRPYPFRYKPQDIDKAPGIYAPYQPRFDWNLWFASLGPWQDYRWVLWVEEHLLQQDRDVLQLFAGNPFAGGAPPKQVRAVIYQYWFTDPQTKRTTGAWWRRTLLGEYAPALENEPDGKIVILDIPTVQPPQL